MTISISGMAQGWTMEFFFSCGGVGRMGGCVLISLGLGADAGVLGVIKGVMED